MKRIRFVLRFAEVAGDYSGRGTLRRRFFVGILLLLLFLYWICLQFKRAGDGKKFGVESDQMVPFVVFDRLCSVQSSSVTSGWTERAGFWACSWPVKDRTVRFRTGGKTGRSGLAFSARKNLGRSGL